MDQEPTSPAQASTINAIPDVVKELLRIVNVIELTNQIPGDLRKLVRKGTDLPTATLNSIVDTLQKNEVLTNGTVVQLKPSDVDNYLVESKSASVYEDDYYKVFD